MAGEYVHLALVYPERALLRDHGNRRLIWALCDCGCFGPPEALGWMGTCCGPCHDRREEAAPPPPGPRTALRCSGVGVAGLAWWGADGSTIVSRAPWERGRVWRTHTDAVEELPLHAPANSLASAPALGLLAYSAAGRLHVTGLEGRRQNLGGPGDNAAHSLAFNQDGSLLAAGGTEGLIVWRLADGQVLLEGHHQTQVIGFAFGGKALATYEPRAGARLRDLTTGQSQFLVRLPRRPNLGDLTLSPDGRWLVAGGWDGTDFHFWRLDRNVVTLPDRKLPPRRQGGGLTFAPDSPVMAYLGWGGRVHFWDVEGAREVGTLSLLGPEATALAFSPDGRTLAVGFEGGVLLWPWRELLGPAPAPREA
jgi:WD40 repeat protein